MKKDYKKLYEEALERAKFLKENTDGVGAKDVSRCFEEIFPELIESEDEKIRKWIVDYLKYRLPDAGEFAEEYKIALNWLEKQGNQKPDFCHHEVDLSDCSEEYRKAYYDGWNNCNQQHAQLEAERKSAWSEDDETFVRDAVAAAEYYYTKGCGQEELVDWLKSLKERITLTTNDNDLKKL